MNSERTEALFLIKDRNSMGYTFYARSKAVEDGVHVDAFSPTGNHPLQWTDTIPQEKVENAMERTGIPDPLLAAVVADYDMDYLQEDLSFSVMGLSMLKEFPRADIPREYWWNNDELPRDDIRFITSRYDLLFYIPNGGLISVDYPNRPAIVAKCEYQDDYHTSINGECYHVCQWAEAMERNDGRCTPGREPICSETEGAWRLGWRNYLMVESGDSGWNHTLYDNAYHAMDAGHLDDPSLTLHGAREQVLEEHGLQHRRREPVNIETVRERAAERAEVEQAEERESVLEKLNSTKSTQTKNTHTAAKARHAEEPAR